MTLTIDHVLSNRAAIRQAKRELSKTALTVLAVYPVALPDEPGPLPLVLVDASTRPEVADLVRVHQLEGDGEIETQWRYYLSQSFAKAVLRVEMSTPVRARFDLCFDLNEHLGALAAMAETGTLLMTTDKPALVPGALTRHPSLGLHCAQDDLRQVIRAHVALGASRAAVRAS
jgi:hypothetical protein